MTMSAVSAVIKTLFVFGTRPEAVKLAPVILHMRRRPAEFDVRVCVTAQHRGMLDQVLSAFEIRPDHDLDIMQAGQSLAALTGRMMSALEPVIASERPDTVVVQGDTTTTLCGALTAFYARIPVAHVEAGLRTGDLTQPFPEEMNRVVTGRLASIHLAATEGAAANLRAEQIANDRIRVTGQSGIDAVLHICSLLERGVLHGDDWSRLDPSRRLIVVTAHRRESFGAGFEDICAALVRLAQRPDVQVVYPVHRNPNVMEPVFRALEGLPNVFLVEPLDYVPFVDLMRRADILITDSGGIQEEGPSLGKPVLVMRDKTERPEAVAVGTVKLVGTNPDRITEAASQLLDNPEMRRAMSRIHNPYGDGQASGRIADAIRTFFES
jgi:UDP-N-acetylglucosamine 2-epimerase (non-hydrolysing)